MERLRALVPSDMAAWVETYSDRPEAEAIASPHDLLPDGPRRFARIRNEHPILAHFERSCDGSAVKLSDFFSPAQYRRLRFYQEFFRPAGVEHQLSIALPRRGPRLIRITLNRRRRDFSERDRLVLNLVRLHVAQAYRNAQAFEHIAAQRSDLERAAEALDVGVIVVRKGGPHGVHEPTSPPAAHRLFRDAPRAGSPSSRRHRGMDRHASAATPGG
jgi:hypothetical protein